MFKIKIAKKSKPAFVLAAIVFAGFLIRAFLAKYFIKESGDLLLYADWAQKYWEYGPKDFYTYPQWYYAPPNYPPLLSLIYAGAWWMFDHKYYLAQLHNIIKIPPASFIVYFYDFGLYLSLKLPGILADLGLGVLIFYLVREITGKVKKEEVAA